MNLIRTAEYYFKHEGQIEGPLSQDELQFLADRGRLTAGDLVRPGNRGEWVEAGSIADFTQKVETDSPHREVKNPLHARWRPVENSVSIDEDTSATSRALPSPLTKSPQKSNRQKLWVAGLVAAILALLLFVLWWFFVGKSEVDAGYSTPHFKTGIEKSKDNSESKARKTSPKGSDQKTKKAKPQPKKASKSKVKRSQATNKNQSDKKKQATKNSNSNSKKEQRRSSGSGSGKHRIGPAEYSIGGGEFFGVKAKGSKFVYIVDCSSSMQGGRLEKVKDEIRRSIHALIPRQKFHVIFFSDRAFPMFYPKKSSKLLRATKSNLDRINKWVKKFNQSGGTNPNDAITIALKMKPDAFFFSPMANSCLVFWM